MDTEQGQAEGRSADLATLEDAAEAVAREPAPISLRLADLPDSIWIDGFPGRPEIRIRAKIPDTGLSVAIERRIGRELLRATDGVDLMTLSDEEQDPIFGLQAQARAIAYGVHLIEAWEGVGGADGKLAPVTPQMIVLLMKHPDIAAHFVAKMRRPRDEVAIEGEG